MQPISRITNEVKRRFRHRTTAIEYIELLSAMCLPYLVKQLLIFKENESSVCKMPIQLIEAIRRFPGQVNIKSVLKGRPDLAQDFSICLLVRIVVSKDGMGLSDLQEVWEDITPDLDNDLSIIAIDRLIIAALIDQHVAGSTQLRPLEPEKAEFGNRDMVTSYLKLDLLGAVVSYHESQTIFFEESLRQIEAAIFMNIMEHEYFNVSILECFLAILNFAVSSNFVTMIYQSVEELSVEQLEKIDDMNLGAIYFLEGITSEK